MPMQYTNTIALSGVLLYFKKNYCETKCLTKLVNAVAALLYMGVGPSVRKKFGPQQSDDICRGDSPPENI